MSSTDATVFVVDDDASFLRSIGRLLRAAGFTVRTCGSSAEFLGQLPADAAGCVIVDLQMPGLNGIELQHALLDAGHVLPVIFLTGHGDIPTTVTAMRHGAEDFLTKRASQVEVLGAVKRALARNERERQRRAHDIELRARFETLTPRDREVLLQVLRGRLNKQIAADLEVDERSIKRHRTSVMSKLKVRSVAELSRLAYEAAAAGTSWLAEGQDTSPRSGAS